MSRMMPLLCIVSCHFEIIIYWHFSTSMFSFSDDVLKGMQMTEVMTLLTSATGHPLVKSFSGTDITLSSPEFLYHKFLVSLIRFQEQAVAYQARGVA